MVTLGSAAVFPTTMPRRGWSQRYGAIEVGQQTLGPVGHVRRYAQGGGTLTFYPPPVMWNLEDPGRLFRRGASLDLDWHLTVWGAELEQLSLEQGKVIGTLLFGRVTYQGMAEH